MTTSDPIPTPCGCEIRMGKKVRPGGLDGLPAAYIDYCDTHAAAFENAEEVRQALYYRECRDYWRQQAESLAERWDKHMRKEHNTLSHEQMFQPPRAAIAKAKGDADDPR